MKRINESILKVGDIVLTTSEKKKSALIRAAIKSDISHAMICVAETSVMDSTSEGVQARNVQKISYEDECAIHVLRLKEPLSDLKLKELVRHVRALTGTSYSLKDAFFSVKPSDNREPSNKQFCSRMVAQAYNLVGVKIVNNPDFCTPEEIKSSPLLRFVDNPWINVSESESEGLVGKEDASEYMRKSTNYILEAARFYDSEVESLNNVDEMIISRPDLDLVMAEVYKESGYLDHWKIDSLRFPQRYDFNLMLLMICGTLVSKEETSLHCMKTVRSFESGEQDHWFINRDGYEKLFNLHGMETFRLLREMYKNLCNSYEKRVSTAKLMLAFLGGKKSSAFKMSSQ